VKINITVGIVKDNENKSDLEVFTEVAEKIVISSLVN
jgi:hypothetical protein